MHETDTIRAILENGGPLAVLLFLAVGPLLFLIREQIKIQQAEGAANRKMIQDEGIANRKMMSEISASSALASSNVVTALHELRDMFLKLDGRLGRN
jgi:hypothetical protein